MTQPWHDPCLQCLLVVCVCVCVVSVLYTNPSAFHYVSYIRTRIPYSYDEQQGVRGGAVCVLRPYVVICFFLWLAGVEPPACFDCICCLLLCADVAHM